MIASAKKDFIVGANIDMLKAVKLASDAEAMGRGMAALLQKVASLKKPFVAAVHGAALGGGFESRSRATRSSPATTRAPASVSRRCSSG